MRPDLSGDPVPHTLAVDKAVAVRGACGAPGRAAYESYTPAAAPRHRSAARFLALAPGAAPARDLATTLTRTSVVLVHRVAGRAHLLLYKAGRERRAEHVAHGLAVHGWSRASGRGCWPGVTAVDDGQGGARERWLANGWHAVDRESFWPSTFGFADGEDSLACNDAAPIATVPG